MENNLIEKTQQSPENMLESVRACLEKGEFDQAARIAKQSRDTDEKPEIFSFLRTVSKADGKCPACGADEIFFFDSCHCEFTDKQPCQNCKRLAIKKAVAGKCQSIMAQRGVASRFADANLKDFPESYRGAIQTDQGVFVHGPRGTGKTHLLVALLRNEVLETEPRKGVLDDLYGDRKVYLEPHYGEFPLFVSTSEFLFEIRSSFKKSSDSTESEILSKYSNAGVLFLDDLGGGETNRLGYINALSANRSTIQPYAKNLCQLKPDP